MWANPTSFFRSWNIVERICFPAPKPSYTIKSFPEELILIPREDGEKVPCLFLPFRHARFLFIYFHANAEDLGLCHTFCTIIRDLFQVHMLAVEYPGYGICPGSPTEEGIRANAQAAVRFALDTLKWPSDGIKLFGRSIGTGAALALAAENEMAGLILVTPFTSIREIVRHQIGSLADLISDRFPNIDVASKIESPTLIIHGQQDTLIPISHSKAIYDALPAKKMMVCPAMMGHNTSLLGNVGTFVLPMTQFFSLPDYTFEDIEVPEWVFPVTSNEEEMESKCLCAPSDWMGGTRRKVMSEWRRGAGSCLGGSSVGFPLDAVNGAGLGQVRPQMSAQTNADFQSHESEASTMAAGSTPNMPLSTADIPTRSAGDNDSRTDKKFLMASRNYDFRTPPSTPRTGIIDSSITQPTASVRSSSRACEKPPNLHGDAIAADVDVSFEAETFPKTEVAENRLVDTPPSSSQPPVLADETPSISKDMQQGIDKGISWLVDTSNDIGFQDKVDSQSFSPIVKEGSRDSDGPQIEPTPVSPTEERC